MNPILVVLTKKIAEKYFGNWQQSLNQFIRLDNAITLRVSGILQDIPLNTDFPLAVLISYQTLKNNASKYNYYPDWNTLSSNFQVFALLPENVNAANINNQLLKFSKDHYKDKRSSARINFLQPLSKLHFDNTLRNIRQSCNEYV